MKIITTTKGTTDCPWLVCSVCDEVINKARPGNVLWLSAEIDGKGFPPLAVHKGACDRTVDPKRVLLSEEASVFMANLAANTSRA